MSPFSIPLRSVLGDPYVARHLGLEMLEQYRGTDIERLMRSAGSTNALLRAAVGALGRLSPAVDVEMVEEGRRHAVVRARTQRGLTRPLCMCDLSKGFLEAVPTFLGGTREAGDVGEIEESECQARGGSVCLYRITWRHRTVTAVEPPIVETPAFDRTEASGRPEQGAHIPDGARDQTTGARDQTTDRTDGAHDHTAGALDETAGVVPVTGAGDEPYAADSEPIGRFDEVVVARLDEQVRMLSERLEEAYLTAADLLAIDSTHGVLGRIAERAARAVNAPRHLLVVRTSLSPENEIHSRGFTEEEKDALAARLLVALPHSFGTDVLMVDIESSRSHYGRLVAFAPSNGFAPDDHRILAAYAAYAAAALDVVTALEQARRSNESASALLDFSRALAGISTVDEVAQRLAETVPLVTGCDRSTVMLWDPTEQALTVRGATGPGAEAARADHTEEERAGYRLHRESTSLFEKVMGSHDLVVVDLSTDDPTVRSVLEATGTACSVIAPLSASDEFFGIVTANFDTTPPSDPRGDLELQTRLISLADHAVTAMQNTRLLEQVTHLAWHDALTGLPNRRLLEDRVNQELVRARRNGESICMFFIDLDRLKQVNDTFGHAAGDDLIRHVAERLVDTVRRQDTVARLGGDEFAVLLPGLADLGDIDTLARRTLEALRRRYTLAGRDVHVSGSIGVAVAPGHGETYDELLSNADAAMYRAKSLGRDTYQLYNVPDGGARPDVQLEVDLKHAVERTEMTVLYQPVVDMSTSEVIAVEALTRWQHPVRGVLDPESFLSLAAGPRGHRRTRQVGRVRGVSSDGLVGDEWRRPAQGVCERGNAEPRRRGLRHLTRARRQVLGNRSGDDRARGLRPRGPGCRRPRSAIGRPARLSRDALRGGRRRDGERRVLADRIHPRVDPEARPVVRPATRRGRRGGGPGRGHRHPDQQAGDPLRCRGRRDPATGQDTSRSGLQVRPGIPVQPASPA